MHLGTSQRLALGAFLALTLTACGGDGGPSVADAASRFDGGMETDAGSTTPDGGSTPDAGGGADAAVAADSGTASDAGVEIDAGLAADAGPAPARMAVWGGIGTVRHVRRAARYGLFDDGFEQAARVCAGIVCATGSIRP